MVHDCCQDVLRLPRFVGVAFISKSEYTFLRCAGYHWPALSSNDDEFLLVQRASEVVGFGAQESLSHRPPRRFCACPILWEGGWRGGGGVITGSHPPGPDVL